MTITMTKKADPASPEARAAFAIERAGGRCEYRTAGCTGTATTTLFDEVWKFHADDAPAWALRACCTVCREKWVR